MVQHKVGRLFGMRSVRCCASCFSRRGSSLPYNVEAVHHLTPEYANAYRKATILEPSPVSFPPHPMCLPIASALLGLLLLRVHNDYRQIYTDSPAVIKRSIGHLTVGLHGVHVCICRWTDTGG